MQLSDKLQKLMQHRGWTQRELAEQLKMSKQAVQAWIVGRNTPGVVSVHKLAQVFEVSPEWLLDDREPAEPSESVADFHAIQRYKLRLSAGAGCDAPEWIELDEPRIFTDDQIQRLHVRPERCRIATVAGDSMFPTLDDGDEVLFEEVQDPSIGAATIADGAIYVISIDNDMRIKRLARVKGGICIKSDNPAYADETYIGDECNALRVYGRVLQVSRLL